MPGSRQPARACLLLLVLLLLTACSSAAPQPSPAAAPPPDATATGTSTAPIIATSVTSATSTNTPKLTRSRTPTLPATAAAPAGGTIRGTLSYPSDGVPALDVYAIGINEMEGITYRTRTESGATTFTIRDVAPGDYHLVAYLADAPTATIAGGYTAAVECGLTFECTDHTLLPVTVAPGATVTDIAVRDWYAPDGSFPPRPQ
jgi:hypothetical protein